MICPACRQRNAAINKPVCLMCWRRVPPNVQKALHMARKRCLDEPEDVLRIQALDAVIKEVITAATEGAAYFRDNR